MKQSDPENSLKAQFVIFRCQKYVKKGYMEMGERIYLELLKSVPGCSVFHYYQGLYKSATHISSNDSKSTNHISLTGTDNCYCKLSKKTTLIYAATYIVDFTISNLL